VSIRHLLLEAALIVVSVLLALSLVSFREHHKQQGLARHALANIRVELTGDLRRIDAGLARHRPAVEHLPDALTDLAAGKIPTTEEPLYPTLLLRSAWTAATTTGVISHMDLRTVQAVARSYEVDSWKSRFEDSWIRLVRTPAPDQNAMRQRLTSLQYLARSYVEVEQEMETAGQGAIKAILAE
jgi:hypothetical protein